MIVAGQTEVRSLTLFHYRQLSSTIKGRLTRAVGRAVNKLMNGMRVHSRGQFTFGKQSLSLFRSYTVTVSQRKRRCNFSH